jgi:hypothetical protein
MEQTMVERPVAAAEQPPPVTSVGDAVRRTPWVWRVAILVGALGWFFTLGASTTTTINGVRTCNGTDAGPLVVAGAVVVLGVVGWRRTRQGPIARRLPPVAVWVGVGVLAALAAAHVLRMLADPSGTMC